MAYLLAICPVCGCEWNRLEPIPEFDALRATTAVRYPLNCPRCGCCGVTPAIDRTVRDQEKFFAEGIKQDTREGTGPVRGSYADYVATRKREIDEHPEWGIKYL